MDCLIAEKVEETICILRCSLLHKEISRSDEDKINKCYSALTKKCYPHKLNKSEDLPYDKEDFASTAETTLPYLKCIKRFLEELSEQTEGLNLLTSGTMQNILVNAFIIASQYQNPSSVWSNQKCSDTAISIIDFLVKFSKSGTLSNLLVGKECNSEYFVKIFPSGVLKLYIFNFSEKITQKTWKNYPSYIDSYLWILYHVKAPHLAGYISYFLPPALFVLDDWELRHKIIGIKALKHILLNTPHSEVRYYGRAEVIYEALKHQIFSREDELLRHVYPVVTMATSILENDPNRMNTIKKTYFDAVLSHVLREMAYEENLSLRSIYAEALKQLIAAMGIHVVRWSKEVLDVCSNYLATYEGDEAQDRIVILQALQIYIGTCWPRVHAHTEVILKMVLKLAYDISLDEPPLKNKEALVVESQRVVELLLVAAPATVARLSDGIEDLDLPRNNFVKLVVSGAVK